MYLDCDTLQVLCIHTSVVNWIWIPILLIRFWDTEVHDGWLTGTLTSGHYWDGILIYLYLIVHRLHNIVVLSMIAGILKLKNRSFDKCSNILQYSINRSDRSPVSPKAKTLYSASSLQTQAWRYCSTHCHELSGLLQIEGPIFVGLLVHMYYQALQTQFVPPWWWEPVPETVWGRHQHNWNSSSATRTNRYSDKECFRVISECEQWGVENIAAIWNDERDRCKQQRYWIYRSRLDNYIEDILEPPQRLPIRLIDCPDSVSDQQSCHEAGAKRNKESSG